MLFNSIEFLLFFPIVTILYFVVPTRFKNYWLLVASYFFYACWNVKYLAIILFITIVSYFGGILLEKKRSKVAVLLLVMICLAVLFFFKYLLFSAGIVAAILERVGVNWNVTSFSIVLPVGISFYTFQAIGYVIDVYRGETKAERKILTYALFVAFFPQLVAGPIERSSNLIKQLKTPCHFDYSRMIEGLFLMLWGLFLKMVIADRAAIFVDSVFLDYNTFSGVYIAVASVLFSVQIYCDFYGYSIIAVGAAKILGISLIENFKQPYLSVTVKDFWRNWHISLNKWFTDYLYIPLGGNRKGRARKYFNEFVVFFLSGLWHGASFSFIAWGILNWLYQVIGELTNGARKKMRSILNIEENDFGLRLFKTLVTFILIDFAWIFFRAKGLTEAIAVVKSMLSGSNIWVLFDGSLYNCGLDSSNFVILVISITILLTVDILNKMGIKVRLFFMSQGYWFRCAFVTAVVLFIVVFGIYGPVYDETGFIYFQF